MQRHILTDDDRLFFMHVPKTAGMTFTELIDQPYMLSEVCPIDRDLTNLLNTYPAHELERFRLIRGHFSYELLENLSYDPYTLIFLREPVGRVISAFNQHRRLDDDHEDFYSDAVKTMSLEEFLSIPTLAYMVTNLAVKFLDGIVPRIGIIDREPDLRRAKDRLAQFDFVGITERFDDSLDLFSYTFGFPPIHYYQSVNRAPDDRLRREEIAQDTIDLITEMNRDELDLYEYGLRLFEERYAQVKQEELANGQQPARCPLTHTLDVDFRRADPGQGWYPGEAHPVYGVFRWSGPPPDTRLYLPLAGGHDLIVRFRVLHAITFQVMESLTLTVNEHPIELRRRQDGRGHFLYEGIVPAGAISPAPFETVFAFRVDQTFAPQDVKLGSSDHRPMGMCFSWLQVYPV